ncbi:UPF0171-domain-containing protein [Pseudohyphozyma bogoriensis]|nr:UPF0171-domain-containing protein [Pseudohyphozyma bogoriensis]
MDSMDVADQQSAPQQAEWDELELADEDEYDDDDEEADRLAAEKWLLDKKPEIKAEDEVEVLVIDDEVPDSQEIQSPPDAAEVPQPALQPYHVPSPTQWQRVVFLPAAEAKKQAEELIAEGHVAVPALNDTYPSFHALRLAGMAAMQSRSTTLYVKEQRSPAGQSGMTIRKWARIVFSPNAEAKEQAAKMLARGPVPVPKLGDRSPSFHDFRLTGIASFLPFNVGFVILGQSPPTQSSGMAINFGCGRYFANSHARCQFQLKVVDKGSHVEVVDGHWSHNHHMPHSKGKEHPTPPVKKDLRPSLTQPPPSSSTTPFAHVNRFADATEWNSAEHLIRVYREQTGVELKIVWSRPPGCFNIGCQHAACDILFFKLRRSLSSSKLALTAEGNIHADDCPFKRSAARSKKRSLEDSPREVGSSKRPRLAFTSAHASTSAVASFARSNSTASLPSAASSVVTSVAPTSAFDLHLLPVTGQERRFIWPPHPSRDPWPLQLSSLLRTIAPKSKVPDYTSAFIKAGMVDTASFVRALSVRVEEGEDWKRELLRAGVPSVELVLFKSGVKRIREGFVR